jgi:cytidylate kinase
MKTSTNLELLPKGPGKIIDRYLTYIEKLRKKPIIIAIDGHSSCGKSTLSKDLAHTLHYRHIDTGAMYRAVTLYFLDNSINWEKEIEIEKALLSISISFDIIDGQSHTFLNNKDVESAIRTLRVSSQVSQVAALSQVRKFLVKQQKALGAHKRIVMDGRDIGTVVFPDAEVKIFMTADPAIRGKRRYEELKARGIEKSYDEIYENLLMRDRIDSTRADSPLSKSPDALTLDSSHLNRQEQLIEVLRLAADNLP